MCFYPIIFLSLSLIIICLLQKLIKLNKKWTLYLTVFHRSLKANLKENNRRKFRTASIKIRLSMWPSVIIQNFSIRFAQNVALKFPIRRCLIIIESTLFWDLEKISL